MVQKHSCPQAVVCRIIATSDHEMRLLQEDTPLSLLEDKPGPAADVHIWGPYWQLKPKA